MSKLPKNPLPFSVPGCYLAGGAILSTVTKTEISDYDLYPKSKEAMITLFYILQESNCFVVNYSDRAVTWKCNDVVKDNGERGIIQVMTFDTFENPEKIFDFFDFSVCMGAFDTDTLEYHFHKDFWPSVASRTLYFNPKTKYPLNSLTRVSKYTSKGYHLPKTQSIKMSLAVINSGMPTSWEELEAAIGGSYGRQIKIMVTDKEFSYEAALEILGDLVLDIDVVTESYDKIKAEHLEVSVTGSTVPILTIPYSNNSMNSSSKTYKIVNGAAVPMDAAEKTALTLLGVNMEEIDPNTMFNGYKWMTHVDGNTYEGLFNFKRVQYTMKEETGEITGLYNTPEMALQPPSSAQTSLCMFSFVASDITSATSRDFHVKRSTFQEVVKC
jgi:hypothetical protein